MPEIIDRTAKSDEWVTRQLQTIGGSNAAAALGMSKWRSPAQLYDAMRLARAGGVPRTEVNDDMRRGSLFEDKARALLADALGVEIATHDQDDFIGRNGWEWAHALPDGWTPDGIVELKVPRPSTCTRVALQGLPDYWIIQGQHNMAVTGAHVCHFGLLDPVAARITHVRLDRDDTLIEQIAAGELAFFERVVNGDPPAPDAPPADVQLPDPGPGAVRVLDTPDAALAAEHYLRVRELVDEAADVLETAKARLIELAEGADVFEVAALLRVYSRTYPGRRLFDADKAKAAFPQLNGDEFYKHAKAARTFRAYPLRKG